MKYLSLFSGIGGFELGIQQAYAISKTEGEQQGGDKKYSSLHGVQFLEPQCIGYSEIDKYATQIYQKNFKNHYNYGDIKQINAEELPDFDLLVGGFPCQAFSIAGKRKGFDDTRGTLFFEIARILKAKQPTGFLLENVKGLLNHDNGQTFATIVATLTELGYDLQWQVLNSKYHGVPQNRERVFIIGHLRGTNRPQVFPFGEDSEEDIERGIHTGTLTSRYPASQREGTYIEENGDRKGEIKQVNQPKHSNDRVYDATGISPTPNTMQGGNRQPFVLEEGKVGVRKLTPMECERLQGFPDNWTDGVSDSQRYKCLGNAVTVNVIKDIMEKLL